MTVSDLGPERFAEFFADLNSEAGAPPREPFPWQQRLVDQLFASGGLWPELLKLPTASGKSSAVDIGLFTLAAGLPVPRRIVFVVDRRAIVQQAAEQARKIRDALMAADSGILAEVRTRLVGLQARVGEDRDPVKVAELRGAIQQDPAWSERPDVAAVIASTVDQVGSRLLFRGYGVSDRMLPVHAGLLANDCLIVLDEVHLARPFSALLSRIRRRFRPASDLPDRWQIVELSATPADADQTGFELDDADYRHPTLSRRLSARKPVRLVTAAAPSDPRKALDAVARVHVQQVQQALSDDRVRSVGVVVNRVRLAAAVHRQLTAAGGDVDVLLLTGRMRGLDREAVLAAVMTRVRAGRGTTGAAESRRLVVVATQTIEAGADLDFDIMVTDCAPIDSLVQRFGRVDRIGRFDAAIGGDIRPHSVIVGTSRLLRDRDDPIYGEALSNTWEALTEVDSSEIDFGILSNDIPKARPELVSPARQGPVLLRNHLDRLVRTSPRPDADVDVDSFLHGLGRQPDPDVEIVWRADLSLETLQRAATPGAPEAQEVLNLLAVVPPRAGEALAIPISHARAWLNRDASPADVLTLSDMEEATPIGSSGRQSRPYVAWRAAAGTVTTEPDDLRPGDTVIVPSEYGGISHHTWDPESTDPVPDIAEPAGLAAGRFVLRLNPVTLDRGLFGLPAMPEGFSGLTAAQQFSVRQSWLMTAADDADLDDPFADRLIPNPDAVEDSDRSPTAGIRHWLERAPHPGLEPVGVWSPERLRARQTALAALRKTLDSRNIHIVDTEFGRLYAVSAPIRALDVDSEPERSQNGGVAYRLDAHLRDVQRWITETASAVGLDEPLISTLGLAGLLHDVGKADHRFQSLLREGLIPGEGEALLAKSAVPPTDRRRSRIARERSGYPPGLRHEAASVTLAASRIAGESLPELLRFLIAAHHGYARPFFPPQLDPELAVICYHGDLGDMTEDDAYRSGKLGAETPRDFHAAVARYGWFGAAWLESIVRLADHGASRQVSAPTDGF